MEEIRVRETALAGITTTENESKGNATSPNSGLEVPALAAGF
jgi:hypothetical protein